MNQNILLLVTAILGFLHIVLRQDYYTPFLSLSKIKKWSNPKTMGIALICSIGHVLGSVVLGGAGVVMVIVLRRLKYFDSMRETLAAYFLIIFGLFYVFYGIRKAYRNRPHKHLHLNPDGTYFTQTHIDKKEHTQFDKLANEKRLIMWSLFVIFVFSPCEVLIPLLVYPAAHKYYMLIINTTIVFAIVSIFTMLIMTGLTLRGARFVRFKRIGIFSHLIVGILVLAYGIAVLFLGI